MHLNHHLRQSLAVDNAIEPVNSRDLVQGQSNYYSYPPNATTLVVFDTKVDSYASLIAGVRSDAAILVLRPDQDGVQQITRALQSAPSIHQLHLVAHGAPGQIELGDRPLNLTTLGDYLWDLQHWFGGRASSEGCSIALYSCQVAAGDAGAEFLQALHRLTGANIAASTTLVGNAALGGDWQLDAAVGTPERELAIAPATLAAYPGTLITLSFTDPELISGAENQEGAIYRFANIAVENGISIDALVTITAINNGATLEDIDEPGGLEDGVDLDAAFSPRVEGAVGADASVDFSIQFVETGTNTPVIVSEFLATAADLDGAPPDDADDADNRGVEFAALTGALNFTPLGGAASELTRADALATGFANIAFLGTPNQGAGFSPQASVTFGYENTSGFQFRAGVIGFAEDAQGDDARQFRLSFDADIFENPNLPLPIPEPTPINTPPIAVNDTATTTPGQPVPISVLDNDEDEEDGIPAGGITQINGVSTDGSPTFTLDSGATVTVNPDNTVTYTPAAGFTGEDQFTYTVADSDGTNVTATVTVTVEEEDDIPPPVPNTPPEANPDTVVYPPDTPVTFDPLINDSDPEDPDGTPSGGITAINDTPIAVNQPVTLPSGSVVQLNPDGTLTYTPAPGLTEPEDFVYTVTDGDGATDTATATLIPEGVPVPTPLAPTANEDLASTLPGTPVTIDLLANDSDPEDGRPAGGITQINGVDIVPGIPATLPSGGVVLLNDDGTITYTPPANFVDGDVETFTYTVADSDGLTSTADVSIAVSELDTDGDGVPDAIDIDDDNDGIPDAIEEQGRPNLDTDGDGIPDRLDLDSDNDGILDLDEAGHGVGDSDGDGRLDGPFGPNGLADILETTPESGQVNYAVFDTDGDGVRDFQDLDSDNDGITDVVEGGGPGQNPDPDGDGIIGTGTPVDTDGDGIADDVDPDNGGTPSPVPDTDGDGLRDYRDIDTDNDGISDLAEQGSGYPDANNDGVVDGVDTDGDGILDPVDEAEGTFGSAPFSIPFPQDLDGGGVPDWREVPTSATGTTGPNVVVGGAVDDILNGFSDPDILSGGAGNDRINGGSDRDVLTGGAGDDILNGGSGNDILNGGSGNDAMSGGSGNDRMQGRKGNDIMSGGRGRDRIRAGAGRDEVFGDAGRDRLFGDRGRDLLDGGRGGDTLVGGFGNDHLTGGQGRDRFVFKDVRDFGDTVKDFEIVNDTLVFDGFDDINSLGDLQLRQRGTNTLIQVRIDGSREKVATLLDVEASTLDAANFSF